MTGIVPNDPTKLTDQDVDYSHFQCCGDEDLVFLRCEACEHIWVECYECSTWYVDLADLSLKDSSFLASDDHRNACPKCAKAFEDLHYLEERTCAKYLPTESQVIEAGLTQFLSEPRRKSIAARKKNEANNHRKRVRVVQRTGTSTVMGVTIGSSAWLFGLGLLLVLKSFRFESLIVIICALSVVLVGVLLTVWARQGTPVNMFQVVFWLLCASFGFGLAAIVFLRARGAIEPILDPDGKQPDLLHFGAPALVLAMMFFISIKPIREFFARIRI